MQIVDNLGGFFLESDFYKQQCFIEEPLMQKIREYTIVTTGFPTQGYLLLQNMGVYERAYDESKVDFPHKKIHILSEIFNLTYEQRLHKMGDPNFIKGLNFLLKSENIKELYANINFKNVTPCKYIGYYCEGDTSYFNVIDQEGNAVSWIQSLSLGFGAGVSVPGTGIILNSRLGRSSTLNPSHPNCCMPGKRPVNTIFPYLVLKDGNLLLVGGTPGGDGQAQWNTAFLSSVLIENKNLFQAISKPRWTYFPGSDLI